jgi:RecA-family ATPase
MTRIYSSEELNHAEPPPEWLIPDFLPQEAFALLLGAPSSFKTFLALDIGLTVCTGVAGGLWPAIATPGPVLYASSEGPARLKHRVAAWERTYYNGREAKDFVSIDPVPRAAEEGTWQDFIDGALKMRPNGYRLVILDTVGRAMQGLNENAQQDASVFIMLVETLRRELGAAVLALHYTGYKAVSRVKLAAPLYLAADTLVLAERNGQEYSVSLTMLKRKGAPEWERSRLASLHKVHLPPGVTSLVVAKPSGPAKA